jgi:hypothetical protein
VSKNDKFIKLSHDIPARILKISRHSFEDVQVTVTPKIPRLKTKAAFAMKSRRINGEE